MQRDANDLHVWSAAPEQTLELLDMAGKARVGRLTVRVLFEEDVQGLFLSAAPRPMPAPPQDTVSVDRLREHIARVGALLRLYRLGAQQYRRLTQWEDPLLSALALAAFCWVCLRVDAEYWLSVPACLLVAALSLAYLRRVGGALQRQFVEQDEGAPAAMHRPAALLRVAVCGFRKLGPAQAPALVKVSYQQSDDEKSELTVATIHPSRPASAVASLSSLMGQLSMRELRRDFILQDVCDPWGADLSYVYPILQPMDVLAEEPSLLPWARHEGCVKITVHTFSAYTLSSLIEKEPTVGVAKVPLKTLVNGRPDALQAEVDLWVSLVWNSADGDGSEELLSGVVFGGGAKPATNGGSAEVRLRLQLDLRRSARTGPEERELSAALLEVVSNLGPGAASNTFSALWNVRENVQVGYLT